MDISQLSLSELRALEQNLAMEIKRQEHEGLVRARQQILTIAQSVGIPLQDLIEIAKPKKNPQKTDTTKEPRKVAAKYRHPRSDVTWTGRGRKPAWILDLIATGSTLEDLLIKDAA